MNRVQVRAVLDTYVQELSRLEEVGWCLEVSHLVANLFQVKGENPREGRACEWVDEISSVEQARTCAWTAISALCEDC